MRSSLAQLRADADALLHAADGNAERAAAKITLKLIEDPHLLVALIADWLWRDKTRPDADLECPVANRE
jgi:hypothetical protein